MALTKCKECGKEISTEAKACPHCGFTPPKRAGCGSVLVLCFLGAIALAVLMPSEHSSTPPATETPEQKAAREAQSRRHVATGGCMEYIKQKLHDPASAEFGHSSDASVEWNDTGDRAYVVRSVRAKNALGGMRLTEFVCLLEMKDGKVYPRLIAERGRDTQASQQLIASFLKGGTTKK